MSDKAFRQFVEEVRAACDRYLFATSSKPATSLKEEIRGLSELAKKARSKKLKGNPICRCGHMLSVHKEPHDNAKGVPENICAGCEADRVPIGCPEFLAKRAMLPASASTAAKSNGTSPASSEGLTACHRAILAALVVNNHNYWTAQQLSILTVYTQSGTFNMAMADLREMGLIEGSPEVQLTAEGKQVAVDVGAGYDGETLQKAWTKKLKAETAMRIIKALAERPADSAADLAERCSYTQSGTFNQMLAKLRRMGLIERGTPIELCAELQ